MIEKILLLHKNELCVSKYPTGFEIGTPPKDCLFWSLSLTPEETSLVCERGDNPPGGELEEGWRAFQVKGPLDFSLTGVLASIASPLAEAGVSIFVISTFDTDYILVKQENLDNVKMILSKDWQIIE